MISSSSPRPLIQRHLDTVTLHLAQLTRAEFELAERRMGSGRTRPILVSVRNAQDEAAQLVLKPTNRLTMPPCEYLFEWMGAAIARALGVEAPDPFAVTIEVEAAEAVEDPELRFDLTKSVGLVYGSRFIGNRGQTQLPSELKPSRSQRETAALVLGMDVFIHNPDRRVQNHNLFVHRDGVIVFDHEAAFSFVVPVLFAPDPVIDPCLGIVDHHALLFWLRGHAELMDAFAERLLFLDDVFWNTLAASAPVEWTQGHASGKVETICELLRHRRDAIQSWLPQVKACLDR